MRKIVIKMLVDMCNMINDHDCHTALDGKCPRSTCEKAWGQAADDILKACRDAEVKG